MADQNINITIESNNNTPRNSNNVLEDFGIISDKNTQTFICKFCETKRNIDYLKKTKCNHPICKTCYFEQNDRTNIICEDCKKNTNHILNNLESNACPNRTLKCIKKYPKTILISTICFLFMLLVLVVTLTSIQYDNDDNIQNKTNDTIGYNNTYKLLKF